MIRYGSMEVRGLVVDRGPRPTVCRLLEPRIDPQRFRHRVQQILEYLEELLQFYHQLPVGLHQIVPEVLFARVYTLPAYLQHNQENRCR